LNMTTKKAKFSGNCARVGFDLRRERTTFDLAAEEESATYLLKKEFVVDWLRASQEQTNPPKSVHGNPALVATPISSVQGAQQPLEH
jgi:hypothetical protein